MIPEKGNDPKDIDNVIFYQLNLNTENKTETYGEHVIVPYDTTTKEIYIDNYYTILKYLEFYHKLYYTKSRKLERGELWLAALMSNSFSELYDILSKILSPDKLELIIEESKKTSEKEILQLLHTDIPSRQILKKAIDTEIAYIKDVRPDIVQSWKYYQKFEKICEDSMLL